MSKFKIIGCCLLLIGLVVICCNSPNEPPQSPATKAQEPVEEAVSTFVCVDENDEQLACSYDLDCCEGFVCVIDRSKGRDKKFCEYNK